MVPVGLAKFPERAAKGIDARGGHVDAAKSAVGRVVRGAIGLCPEAGKALRLVAPGEKRQLFRGGIADRFEPGGRLLQGLVPRDFLELPRPARACPPQWIAQAGRRVDLHDPGRAFGAEHTLVDRVIAVALDIGDFLFAVGARLQMYVDPAAAGAHVAGGLFDFVRDMGREVDCRLIHQGLCGCLGQCGGYFGTVLPQMRHLGNG